MATDDQVDELFDVKNLFYLGNYQQAINEASTLKPSNKDVAVERDVFLMRSYIAQKKYGIVLSEVKASAPPVLKAAKTLAEYFAAGGDTEKKQTALETLKDLQQTSTDPYIEVLTATALFHEGNYPEVLRLLRFFGNLECHAQCIQALLCMNRTDLARAELAKMRQKEDDATLTNLAEAWVNLALGGEKYNEAFFIFQELAQKYTVSVKLLNGQAACHMHQGKFADAEDLLMEALDRNNNDPETLINLIVCAQNLHKTPEVVTRYLSQLKEVEPRHKFILDIEAKERAFDRAAQRFAPEIA